MIIVLGIVVSHQKRCYTVLSLLYKADYGQSKANRDFNFKDGQVLQNKFLIGKKLGGGYESEVYRVKECLTGVTCSKVFLSPQKYW